MRQGVVDGVPLVWSPSEDAFVGSLALRVGPPFEAPLEYGSSQLIASAVMRALADRPTLTVALDGISVSFMSLGERDEVVADLAAVCRVLTRLSPADIAVALAEAPADPVGLEDARFAWHLFWRYGHTGLGRIGAPRVVPEPRVEDVLAFARRHILASSAAYTFTGEPPTGTGRLALPEGPRPVRPPSCPLPHAFPVVVRGDVSGPSLSFEGPATAAQEVLCAVILDRLRERLTAARLPAEVDWPNLLLTPSTCVTAITGEGTGAVGEEVAATMVAVVNELADSGPSPRELEDARRLVARSYVDEDVVGRLDEAAGEMASVGSITTADDIGAELDEASAAQVRQLAQQARASALVGVPADGAGSSHGPVGGVAEALDRAPSRRPPRAARWWRPRPEVTVDDGGVWSWRENEWVGGPWSRVAGVARTGGSRTLLLLDGRRVDVTGPAVRQVDLRTADRQWDTRA